MTIETEEPTVADRETWAEIWKAYIEGELSVIDMLDTPTYLGLTADHAQYSCVVEAVVAKSWGLTDG